MKAVPVKKRLRRLHQLLVNSRHALEHTSQAVSNTLLGDLLFMLSCRRNIMLNELDRELDRLHIPNKPDPQAERLFLEFPTADNSPRHYVEACEAEEIFLVGQLESLKTEPGLRRQTREAISKLLHEAQANMEDILFLRENHSALRA
jgi:hypothetical protein